MELQPKRNIEIKARCKDLNAARARAESLGAKFAGTLDQVDTYFHVPNGRLKVRQIYNEHTELIFYSRENITEPRPCDYHVITITEWDKSVIAVLSKAMGVRGIVRKRRELLLWHNVRIHLDEVEKLGTFIELEAV